MPTAQKRIHSPQHKKRHGQHHKHGKHYVRVYWPYLPLLLIIFAGIMMQFFPTKWDVLAYATNLSREGLLQATNTQRELNGSGKLTLNDKLNAAAQAKANDMASRNYWSHNTPEGNEPWIFIIDTGYMYKKAGENLAYGFASNNATINGWMNSPSHKANLLDGNYQEVGFGYANVPDYQNKGPVTVVVAMYGTPLGSPVVAAAEPDSTGSPVNTASPIENSAPQAVNVAQSVSGTQSWIPFSVGILTGLAIAIAVVKHGLSLRRLLLRGEAFFLHHPVLDVALLVVIAVGLYMSRTAGFII